MKSRVNAGKHRGQEAIARELKQANDSGGISPETMTRIERELKLL